MKRLTTGDEQEVTHEMHSGRKKSDAMFLWDRNRIVRYESLPPGKVIHSDLFCERWTRLQQVSYWKNRPDLVNRDAATLHRSNVGLRTSLATRRNSREPD